MAIVAGEANSVPTGSASPAWQAALKTAVRDVDQLGRRLQLNPAWAAAARGAADDFPVFVPEEFLRRMVPGDPRDPLLLQVLPQGVEREPAPGFDHDPVGDRSAVRSPGLLQKYAGRALLMLSGTCAVHCRYCFRRHFPYEQRPSGFRQWQPALDQLANDPSLHEVIFSGGDPLMLVDSQLAQLAARLAEIPHLTRLRVHTRLPIMIPSRVTDALLGWLTASRLQPIVVVHVNHPHELDEPTSQALRSLVAAGIPTLNQAVLLKDVNDRIEVLEGLCRRLVDLGVMPYYLHQLDRVAGAAHFEVATERGVALMAELQARLPGYAVPRYVREIPGAPHKVAVVQGW